MSAIASPFVLLCSWYGEQPMTVDACTRLGEIVSES